jgi:hypothetical protein
MNVSKENFMVLLPSLKLACSYMKGQERRLFLGQLATDLGLGGQILVSENLPISRETLRKGVRELKSGEVQEDKFRDRGRKPLEELNPKLLAAIKDIVDKASQIDPQFKSTRLYTRLSVREVRQQLIKQGYEDADLPSNQTIWNKLYALGYKRRKVAKTKPKKK